MVVMNVFGADDSDPLRIGIALPSQGDGASPSCLVVASAASFITGLSRCPLPCAFLPTIFFAASLNRCASGPVTDLLVDFP